MSEQDATSQSSDEHPDEVFVDTANLPELMLIAQSGSVDAYLSAIGIDPSIFDEAEGQA